MNAAEILLPCAQWVSQGPGLEQEAHVRFRTVQGTDNRRRKRSARGAGRLPWQPFSHVYKSSTLDERTEAVAAIHRRRQP